MFSSALSHRVALAVLPFQPKPHPVLIKEVDMHRPPEWVKQRNIYFESHQEKNRWGKTRQLDYEAGADADREALKKQGYRISDKTVMATAPIFKQGNGWLVFIEEEE